MKKAILVAIVSAMTLGVNAGDWGKAPVGKAPIEDCVYIGGQISVGYMTDYYFKGVQMAEDSVLADVNYTFDGLAVPVTVGATYINGIHFFVFDELALYANAAVGTFFGFDTVLGYAYHLYPEMGNEGNSFGEFKLDVRRSLGFADLILGTSYMHGAHHDSSDNTGWYHHAGLERGFGLTDNIDLVLAAGVGYLDGHIDLDDAGTLAGDQGYNGWNHYYVRASLPIALNCRATLTPYVEYHHRGSGFDHDEFNGQDVEDSNVSAGVSVSVTF